MLDIVSKTARKCCVKLEASVFCGVERVVFTPPPGRRFFARLDQERQFLRFDVISSRSLVIVPNPVAPPPDTYFSKCVWHATVGKI